MNELPRFSGDRGEWVYDRIAVIRCNNIIPEEKRDAELIDKLFSEREAILNAYLLPALHEVINNKYKFDIPASCISEMNTYKRDNNPVLRFYTECCTNRPNGKITDNCTTKKMYDVFKAWCKDNNNGYTISKQEFNKELISFFKVSDIKHIEKKLNGTRYYIFTLTTETKQDYPIIYGVDSVIKN
jgi:phage/plasmid-associated DNA primase